MLAEKQAGNFSLEKSTALWYYRRQVVTDWKCCVASITQDFNRVSFLSKRPIYVLKFIYDPAGSPQAHTRVSRWSTALDITHTATGMLVRHATQISTNGISWTLSVLVRQTHLCDGRGSVLDVNIEMFNVSWPRGIYWYPQTTSIIEIWFGVKIVQQEWNLQMHILPHTIPHRVFAIWVDWRCIADTYLLFSLLFLPSVSAKRGWFSCVYNSRMHA